MKQFTSLIFTSFILLISLNTFGQRIRYRDVKNDFSTRNYRETVKTKRYSPIIAGACNYLIPATGYFYVEEPLRGVVVLTSEIISSSFFVTGLVLSMGINYETGKSPKGARELLLSGLVATSVIQVWSIFDVVKIAKIKNMASQNNNVTWNIHPDLQLLPITETNSPIYGLKLNINF